MSDADILINCLTNRVSSLKDELEVFNEEYGEYGPDDWDDLEAVSHCQGGVDSIRIALIQARGKGVTGLDEVIELARC